MDSFNLRIYKYVHRYTFIHPFHKEDMIDEKLLNILACPQCKGDIRLEGDKLICDACKLAYPIKDDIPIMLIDEAETIQ